MAEYDADVPAGIVMTSMEAIVGWLRKTSFWPLTMGLACCAIEMISYGGPRADAARWGLSPSGRPHDRFGPGKPEDGPGGPSALRPNARTQVGYLDGGLRILWRHL